jgi:large subunit ribosomal protein L21
VFEDGGKQYKVSEGDALLIERREIPEGETGLEFNQVLMVGEGEGAKIGQPYVPGASVTARLLDDLRMPKVVGIKFSRRKGYKKKWGHRQRMMKVEITSIRA